MEASAAAVRASVERDALCTTCGHPVWSGYLNIKGGEQCCDPCHGPYLTPMSNQSARFVAFHGRKAKKMMRRVA